MQPFENFWTQSVLLEIYLLVWFDLFLYFSRKHIFEYSGKTKNFGIEIEYVSQELPLDSKSYSCVEQRYWNVIVYKICLPDNIIGRYVRKRNLELNWYTSVLLVPWSYRGTHYILAVKNPTK